MYGPSGFYAVLCHFRILVFKFFIQYKYQHNYEINTIAVKQLIASKIKVFIYIICVCTVYIYYVYIEKCGFPN